MKIDLTGTGLSANLHSALVRSRPSLSSPLGTMTPAGLFTLGLLSLLCLTSVPASLSPGLEEMIEAGLGSLQARRGRQEVGTGKGQFSRIRDEDRELADLAAR